MKRASAHRGPQHTPPLVREPSGSARVSGPPAVAPRAVWAAACLVAIAGVCVSAPALATGEFSAGVQTTVPVDVGLEVAGGITDAFQVVLTGGLTPNGYVNIIEQFAEDPESSAVIHGTLGGALGGSLQVRVHPVQDFGMFLSVGYSLYLVSGSILVDPGPLVQEQPLQEEPDTGGGLAPGPQPDGGGGDGADLPSARREDVKSWIHMLRAGLGYRYTAGHFYVQMELALLKAISASSTPEGLDEYLRQVYVDSLLVPVGGVGVGVRF